MPELYERLVASIEKLLVDDSIEGKLLMGILVRQDVPADALFDAINMVEQLPKEGR